MVPEMARPVRKKGALGGRRSGRGRGRGRVALIQRQSSVSHEPSGMLRRDRPQFVRHCSRSEDTLPRRRPPSTVSRAGDAAERDAGRLSGFGRRGRSTPGVLSVRRPTEFSDHHPLKGALYWQPYSEGVTRFG